MKNIEYYEKFYNEDKRAYGTKADQIEFIYTKKLLKQYIKPDSSVIEIGCGTGYYGLYLSSFCRHYNGIDLTPKHIEIFKSKIKEQNIHNLSASIGDATNLSDTEDNSFDVVLVFGPMYHLPPEKRKSVIKESKRICKKDGYILFAYINKIGAYIKAYLDNTVEVDYPNKKTNDFVLKKGTDDIFPDLFFFTMPEEIERDVAEQELKIIQNAGVNFTFNAQGINKMSDEKYEAWTEIMDFMYSSKSCTGFSNHAILVCQK